MIDFGRQLKTLDGKDAGDMAQLVANVLIQGTEGNAIKLYDIATTIYKEKKIKLDDSDKKLVKETIDGAKGLTILAKAQILKLF